MQQQYRIQPSLFVFFVFAGSSNHQGAMAHTVFRFVDDWSTSCCFLTVLRGQFCSHRLFSGPPLRGATSAIAHLFGIQALGLDPYPNAGGAGLTPSDTLEGNGIYTQGHHSLVGEESSLILSDTRGMQG